jgi:AcrR family transcriptional regulator
MDDLDPRPTQAERKERSTRALLDAAASLIAEQGFARTTLAQIGEKAGYSRGLVNERFGSKRRLIRTLADEFQNYFTVDLLEPALDGRSGVEALLATIDSYIDAVKRSGDLGRAYYELFGESIALIPEIHDLFVRADRNLRELLRQTIAEARLSDDVDVPALANVVLAVLRGVAMQWVREPAAIDLDAAKREIRRLIEAAFAAHRGPE